MLILFDGTKWREILKPYPWRFIGYIFLCFLIPTIYDLTNVFWIGHFINQNSLAITEQYEFLADTIEIVNEAIPFGVLALVAQNYRDKEKAFSIMKAGLVIQMFFSVALTGVVILFTPQFVSTLGTPPAIVDATKAYLIMKSLAIPFDSMAIVLLILIKSLQKGKEALILVGLSVALNVATDLFLISNLSFSLQLGTNGVAIGYILSKVVLFSASIAYAFRILGFSFRSFLNTVSFRTQIKPLFKIGGWTGLDSLVRNVGYMGQLTILNKIGESEYGGYGLAMWVMWTLLIPILAIGQGTSVAVGNLYGERRYGDMKRVLVTSIVLSTIIMLGITVGGVFLWGNISAFFNNNPKMVVFSVSTFWWLIIPYILFGIGNTVKSLFFGTGYTKYIFLISCVANFLLVIPFVLLARAGWFLATYDNVMELFVVVFMEDLIVTAFVARHLLKRIDKETRDAAELSTIT